jgi:3-dehydroshikimate dehydratase
MVGLTSVTFRKLGAREIIALAAREGLGGIEWGGDVHIPPGDLVQAKTVRRITEEAGLRVLSYGSYYRLCEQVAGQDFAQVFAAACALGAPNIRIWAGAFSPRQADSAYCTRAAEELRRIAGLAAKQGITISLEYHRNTLTETPESALNLLNAAEAPNVRTYWQPNPERTVKENCAELCAVLPWVSNVHVFQWTLGNVRRPLEEGAGEWGQYLRILGESGGEHAYLLEFVQNDDPACFCRDACTLKGWMET